MSPLNKYVISLLMVFANSQALGASAQKLACAGALSDESGVVDAWRKDPEHRHGVLNAVQINDSFVMPWIVQGHGDDRVVVSYVYTKETVHRCELPLPQLDQEIDYSLKIEGQEDPLWFSVRTIETVGRGPKGRPVKKMDFLTGTPRSKPMLTKSVVCQPDDIADDSYLEMYILTALKEAKGACVNRSNLISSRICWDQKNRYFSNAQNSCHGISAQVDKLLKSLTPAKSLAKQF